MARLCELPNTGIQQVGADAFQDKIWSLLTQALANDWTDQATWRGHRPGIDLSLHRGGDWKTDSPVDDSAGALLDALAPVVCTASIVVAQLGQSLDGRIATRTGHSHYINGAAALTHLHRLRALVDAVLVGAGTACADRPRLNVRHVPGRNPACVVVDPSGRVPADGPLFKPSDSPRKVFHLVGPDACQARTPDHVERIVLQPGTGGFAPRDILTILRERGLNRVLVEGGADTVSRFVDAGEVDRLHLLVAPLIIGSGRNGLELPPIDRLEQARRPPMRCYSLDDELLIDVDLRNRNGP